MAKDLKGKVKYLPGFVSDLKGVQIETQRDAWKKDADCGCGIDCCNKKFVLEDQQTGNGVSLYFHNGELRISIEGGGVFRATLTPVT